MKDKLKQNYEKIINILERTIAAEVSLNKRIFNKYIDQNEVIASWSHSYRLLNWNYKKVIEEIQVLIKYIKKQKEIKSKRRKKK